MTDTSWIKHGVAAVMRTSDGCRYPCIIYATYRQWWHMIERVEVLVLMRNIEDGRQKVFSRIVKASQLRPRLPAEEAEIDHLIPKPANTEKGE